MVTRPEYIGLKEFMLAKIQLAYEKYILINDNA